MRAFANRKVLVLNKSFTAIGVVSLKRAILMLFSNDARGTPKAHIIDENTTPVTWEQWSAIRPKEGEPAIHACKEMYRIPEIIKLNRYDKLPSQKIRFSRNTIYKRDALTCQYCLKRFPTSELSIDHLIPSSLGGLTTWTNCLLACMDCNKAKADRMPKQQGKIYTVFFKNRDRQWQVQVREPQKPAQNLFSGEIHYDSWKNWLDQMYWNVELENDNK